MAQGAGGGSKEEWLRRAPRLSTRLKGRLLGRTALDVEIIDLSLSGCLMRCETRFDRGMFLDLELTLGDEALESKARVVDCSSDGEVGPGAGPLYLVGLTFVTFPPNGEYRLRRFLDDQKKRQDRTP